MHPGEEQKDQSETERSLWRQTPPVRGEVGCSCLITPSSYHLVSVLRLSVIHQNEGGSTFHRVFPFSAVRT